jgi:hypothetical protein
MAATQYKTLQFTPTRVLSTWAITGGSSGSVVVFTVVGDNEGNEGVVVRHHAYKGNPREFMLEFCVWDGGGNVAIRHGDILPMDTARGVWKRFISTRESPSYKEWLLTSPVRYTVPPNEFLASFGVF